MFFRVKLVTSSDHSGLSLFYQIVRFAEYRDLQRITFTVNVLEDEEKDEDNEISKRVNLLVLLLAKSKLEWKSFLSSKPTPYHAMVMGTIELENFSNSTQLLSFMNSLKDIAATNQSERAGTQEMGKVSLKVSCPRITSIIWGLCGELGWYNQNILYSMPFKSISLIHMVNVEVTDCYQ